MNNPYKLYGAILGDLAGQPFEFPPMKGPYHEVDLHNPTSKFTDDTLMTLASASYLLGHFTSIEEAYKDMGRKYPGDHYGRGFKNWLNSPNGTVNDSWGNGALMRISPFMYLENSEEKQFKVVQSCMTSHNHPISIIAALDLLNLYKGSGMRRHATKYQPEQHLKRFDKFEIAADKTLKFVENAYWLTKSTETAIVKAISYGGDTDTNASILGELMNYTFGDLSPKSIEYVEFKLDAYLLSILKEFNEKFK